MNTNLEIARPHTTRIFLLAVVFGLWGGLMAAGIGYVSAALTAPYLFLDSRPLIVLSMQAWTIFGATHAVYYALRQYAGSVRYWSVAAGGFVGGLLVYLGWAALPEGLNYALLLALPILGAVSGYLAGGTVKPAR